MCRVEIRDYGFCLNPEAAGTAAAEAEQLKKTLAAIKAGRSVPADGPFVYLRKGTEYVVMRRCGAVEVGRVAVAEVPPMHGVGVG